MRNKHQLDESELLDFFMRKYGPLEEGGWSPRLMHKFNHYTASDIYEATVSKLVTPSSIWVDVGGGSAVFPYDERLSHEVAGRAAKLVAVDPSPNIRENPFATERAECTFEDFSSTDKFTLATFRMVAEHVTEPTAVVDKLAEVMAPGGLVVVYTINKWSPVPLITRATPFALHYKVKKFFWRGEEKDTFPVAYKMNTRNALSKHFERGGFEEAHFEYLDDLSVFHRFFAMNYLELCLWTVCRKLGVRYPENNLLGIYQKK
jgi:2-polyprenyl-3-methyl-5-hydroxy-6-metoxy-1,4-benzoquinol methylase